MTDITALIQELVDAGCDPIIAGSVVARVLATGASTAPYRPKTGAERTAEWRAREVTECDENVTNVTNVTSTLSLKKDSFLEKKERKKERESTNRRGTRCPVNWSPSSDDHFYARSQGMPEELAAREAEKFRDYWSAKTGPRSTSLNWSANWRNWVRRVCEDKGFATGPPQAAMEEAEIVRLFERHEAKKARQE